MLSQALVYSIYKTDHYEKNFLAAAVVVVVHTATVAFFFFRNNKKPRLICCQLFYFVASFSMMLLIGPLIFNLVFRESLEVTFATYMMLAFLTRSFQFKNYAILIVTLSVAFIGHNFYEVGKEIINMEIFVVESLMNSIFVGFLLLMIYNREMRSRKIYNNERIIEVEIRRTEE